jgi:hypothetical protein
LKLSLVDGRPNPSLFEDLRHLAFPQVIYLAEIAKEPDSVLLLILGIIAENE